jgi:transcriptional regulator with XRE-family HTH domain
MPLNDPDRLMKNIGRRVAELRVERGQTQERIAVEANVSLTYWRRTEAGANLTVRSLARVADILHVDVIELFRPPQRNARLPRVKARKPRRG